MPARPLQGVTVVDLSRLLPGPLAARLLADLGARVIKVEEPRLGDPVRMAPPRTRGGRGPSALATLLLSGVESIALDLKKSGGRRVLEALLERADVLLDSFRPGTLARLGLDPEELGRRYPRLVHCSLSGWGQEGPLAGRAGHDLTYQALAGTLAPGTPTGDAASRNARLAAPSAPSMPAVPVADLTGAWSVVAAVLAALVERARTGRGRRIDASLYDAALHANLAGWAAEAGGVAEGSETEGEGRAVGEPLSLTGALPCYGLYRTADGSWLALAALEPHFWRRLCDAVDRPDLRRAGLDAGARSRARVAELVASRTGEEWSALFAEHDLPGEVVLSAAAAREHPQARHRGVVEAGEDGALRVGFPALLDGERPRAADHYPDLGEDTGALLGELGLTGSRLPRSERRGAVGKRWSWKRLLARWWVG